VVHVYLWFFERPDEFEPVEVYEGLEAGHHKLERDELNEPEEELDVASWDKLHGCHIGDHKQFNTKFTFKVVHLLLFVRKVECVDQITKTLGEHISSDKEVPKINEKHTSFQKL